MQDFVIHIGWWCLLASHAATAVAQAVVSTHNTNRPLHSWVVSQSYHTWCCWAGCMTTVGRYAKLTASLNHIWISDLSVCSQHSIHSHTTTCWYGAQCVSCLNQVVAWKQALTSAACNSRMHLHAIANLMHLHAIANLTHLHAIANLTHLHVIASLALWKLPHFETCLALLDVSS